MTKAKQIRKKQILMSAYQVFSEKGFDNAKVEEIATLAGIGKGTIYEYFPSKNDLFCQCVSMLLDEFNTEVSKIVESDTNLRYKIESFINHSIECYSSGYFIFNAIEKHSNMIVDLKEIFENKVGNDIYNLEKLIKSAQETGEVRKDIDVIHLIPLLHAIIHQVFINSEREINICVETQLDILFNGISSN